MTCSENFARKFDPDDDNDDDDEDDDDHASDGASDDASDGASDDASDDASDQILLTAQRYPRLSGKGGEGGGGGNGGGGRARCRLHLRQTAFWSGRVKPAALDSPLIVSPKRIMSVQVRPLKFALVFGVYETGTDGGGGGGGGGR